MNPITYFGPPFVTQMIMNQYVHQTFYAMDVVHFHQVCPIDLTVFRQHVGVTCVKYDHYFDYEDSNDLIEALQNAEFDSYLQELTPSVIERTLLDAQVGYVKDNCVYNAALTKVW